MRTCPESTLMKSSLFLACALAWSLAATQAHAAENTTLTDPVWMQQAPSFADVVAAYPALAKASRKEGKVRLNCAFDADGRLNPCQVVDEIPRGAGFAKAALALSTRFQGPTTLANGHNIAGSHAQLWIKFAPDLLTASNVLVPEWSALPTAAQFQGAFPEAAAKAGVLKARAAMTCKVGADGGLTGCVSVFEEPTGYGFGEQTLPLAPLFKVKLWGDDGRPVVGGTVRAPIRYDLTQVKPPKP
jgi:hypothetical protein